MSTGIDFFTFYATTCPEKCNHHPIVATTGAFTLTSVLMCITLSAFGYAVDHTNHRVNNRGADLTAGMCRLIYPFVIGMHQSQIFLQLGPTKKNSDGAFFTLVGFSVFSGTSALIIPNTVIQRTFTHVLSCQPRVTVMYVSFTKISVTYNQ